MKRFILIVYIILIMIIISCQSKKEISKNYQNNDVTRRQSLYKTNNLNYFFALKLEDKWSKDKNLNTKKDLEKYVLKWSKVREISPEDSMWGYRYKLKENERMIQYLILGTEPLDVVYDENDNIIDIYTSYE